LAMTFGYLWSAILLPIFGWVSDYTGRKALLFATALLFVVFGFPLFSLLQLQTRLALFCFIFFGQTIIAAMAACYFALLPQAFPTEVRYTGTAFSYNIAYTIAALIPLVASYIYEVLKQPNCMAVLFVTLAVITAISVLALKDKDNHAK